MTTSWHVPDPVQGAAIDALFGGLAGISMPNDDELVRAAIARLPAEMLADWTAYYRLCVATGPIQISAAAATYNLERLRHHWCHSPSAGAIVYTIPATAPVGGWRQGEVIEVDIYNMTAGQSIDIQRPGGQSVVLFDGGAGGVWAHCRLRYLGASFKLQEATGNGTITYGVPG